LVALSVCTNCAGVATIKISTLLACHHRTRCFRQGGREGQHARLRLLQQFQSGAPGTSWAKTWQFRQQPNQPLDFRTAHKKR
jgi:hypothetical protein